MADITFAKKTTLDSLNSDISSYLSSTKHRIDISKSIIESGGWNSVSTLPNTFHLGSAVVFNNEIHILGGLSSDTAHYKWNGRSWESVSTLPYKFYSGSAVVYNNEIHIIGTAYNETQSRNHYKWDGSSWTSVGLITHSSFNAVKAVVFDNKIHLVTYRMDSDGDTYKYHYTYDGSSWAILSSTLPFNCDRSSIIVYNNEIHLLGGYNSSKIHYKFDGSSWISVGTLPYNFYEGDVAVIDNELHILGSTGTAYRTKHYKYNGTSWTSVDTLPYSFLSGCSLVYNNSLHLLGGTGGYTNHYKWSSSLSSVSYQLFKGMKIICDKSNFTPLSSNLSEIIDGYQVTETGLTQLKSVEVISETNRPLLTILS